MAFGAGGGGGLHIPNFNPGLPPGSAPPPSVPELPTTFLPPIGGPGMARGPVYAPKQPTHTVPAEGWRVLSGGVTPPPSSSSALKGGQQQKPTGRSTGGATKPGTGKPARTLPPGQHYGGYTPEQLLANPALEAKLGKPAMDRWKLDKAKYAKPTNQPPPPGPTTPPPPGPTQPGSSGGAAPVLTNPSQPTSSAPREPLINPWDLANSGAPQPYAFDDAFNQILATIPVMDLNAKRAVGQSMADAGFTGNRYGSAAMRKAGEIGAENSMAQNAMMNQVLFDASQKAQDRSLAATGMGTELGGLLNAITQGKLGALTGAGQWEQGRTDDMSQKAYEDFERNKLGWLPMLLQAAMSQKAGSPGSTYTVQQPGKPGTADTWLPILAGLLG